MSQPCADCFSCKTRVFREVGTFYDWVFPKFQRPVSEKAVREIERIIRNRGEVRLYWCTFKGVGPYLRISEIPWKSCRKVNKN